MLLFIKVGIEVSTLTFFNNSATTIFLTMLGTMLYVALLKARSFCRIKIKQKHSILNTEKWNIDTWNIECSLQ